MHDMYEGMKVAFGTYNNKDAPLKSRAGEFINDHSKLIEQWADHYEDLYFTEAIISDTALKTHLLCPPWKNLTYLQ